MTIPQPIAALVAVSAVLLLAGCAGAPAPRTTPDSVERSALRVARQSSSVTEAQQSSTWRQLWTPSAGAKAIGECASGSGVRVSVQIDPAGGFVFSISPNPYDANAINAVPARIERCVASHPIDDRVSSLSPSKWGALYSYDVTVLRRCLMAQGFSMSQMPSRSDFLSLMRTGAFWSPYDEVSVSTRAQWYALSDACPEVPPHLAAGL